MAIAHDAHNEQRPTLRKEGQGWLWCYLGVDVWIQDNLGMRCINLLFLKPGEYIAVLEVYRAAYGQNMSGGMDPSRTMSAQQLANEGFHLDNFQSDDPVMRPNDLQRWKRMLRELREEFEEAEANHSPRVPALRAQIEELEDFILANVDHRGRPRQSRGPVKQAQENVRKAIMRVINLLSIIYPPLSAYLKLTIITGYTCCFDPNRIPPAAGRP